jgi:uncharacterized cupin superfamily protein
MLESVKIGRADAVGRFGPVGIVTPPGPGGPWHVHEEDEWFHALEGDLTMYAGVI